MELSELEEFHLTYCNPGSQLKDAIIRQSKIFFAAGETARDQICSREMLLRRQQELRQYLFDCFGGLPSSDTPLNARVTGTLHCSGFVIEKVVFESRPRHYVTANLYLPEKRAEKTPAVLFLCGHAPLGKAYTNYQWVCQLLVRAGLIVLAQDPIGQGERLSYYDSVLGKPRVRPCTLEHDYAGIPAALVGDHIARYFLHDAMRSLDYLCSRPEVDASRLGVTGNSGGGTQTCLLMAADPRVSAAAPGTFIMSRESYLYTGQAQDAEQVWPGFTAAGFDHEDLLLAMAPKPLAVLAVKSDFFPIEGTRRSVERVRRFWAMLEGKDENLLYYEDANVHGYTLHLARVAVRFFARHLLGKDIDTSQWEATSLPATDLNCTSSGQVSSEFPDAEFVFHATAARARELAAKRRALPTSERRQQAVQWLREKVFAPRKDIPYELTPRLILRDEVFQAFDVDIAFWYPQPYVANLGFLFRPAGAGAGPLGITVAVWRDGTCNLRDHWDWMAQETAKGRAVLVLNLAGMGPLLPDPNNSGGAAHTFYGTLYKLDDELRWNGDSLAALRVWEVIRALDALEQLEAWSFLRKDDIHLYGHGPEGVYARLASILDPRIKGHQWEGAFTWTQLASNRFYNSYNIKPLTIPGALQVLDLDEWESP